MARVKAIRGGAPQAPAPNGQTPEPNDGLNLSSEAKLRHERTARRQRRCRICKQPLTFQDKGRLPVYCSDMCRWRAYRRRKRALFPPPRTCEYETPTWLFKQLDREFHFTLDVCATEKNAKCKRFYTRKENGLKQPWTGRVWCNPPFGRSKDGSLLGHWIRKAYGSVLSGDVEVAVCLIPVRSEMNWFHDYCLKGEVRYLKGKLTFEGQKDCAKFPSAIVVFRGADLRHEILGTKDEKGNEAV